MLWLCPSIRPSLCPGFPDFFQPALRPQLKTWYIHSVGSNDMSSFSFIAVWSLWPAFHALAEHKCVGVCIFAVRYKCVGVRTKCIECEIGCMHLYRQKCIGVWVQLFKWGRSVLGVRWKCAHLHMWSARECAGSAFISISEMRWSALGVRSLAYLECIAVRWKCVL